MNSTINSTILWKNLSEEQKKFGVSPVVLSSVRFEKNDLLLEGFYQQLASFLIGCKMAASQRNFFHACALVCEGEDPLLDKIRAVAGSILLTPMPKERALERDQGGLYSIRFCNEGSGQDHLQYVADFSSVYDRLIRKGRAHLMHPARRDSLMKRLSKYNWDSKCMADRLITYRCFGKTAFAIKEKKRQLEEDWEKLEANRLAFSKLQGPCKINWESFKEKDLDCISVNSRKYVFAICKKFADKGNLTSLNPNLTTIFIRTKPFCDSFFHEDLESIAKIYSKERQGYGFEEVIAYAQALKDGDLNNLRKELLLKEESCLRWAILSGELELKKLEEEGEKQSDLFLQAWALSQKALDSLCLALPV